MINLLIERVEVHAPTGGRGASRHQRIDVYFSFIGDYLLPNAGPTEAERVAQIIRQQELKKKANQQKASQKQAERLKDLKERADYDDEAKAALEEHRLKVKAYKAHSKERKKERMASDPVYREQEEAKQKVRSARSTARINAKRADLKARAATDPDAAAEYAALLERERKSRNARKEHKQATKQIQYEKGEQANEASNADNDKSG